MTVLGWLILAALLVAAGALIRLCVLLGQAHTEVIDHGHAKCIAHVTQFMGDEFAARILDQAAHDWDSTDEQHRLKVLARMHYKDGGQGVPAIWLRDRAAILRGAEDVAPLG